jgi:DNA-binding NarL/FixJ family response regulator
MVIFCISHVRLLREALLAALNDTDGVKALGAFSRDTAEAAALEFTPSLVIVDASHPEAAMLVAAVQSSNALVRIIVLTTRERDEDLLTWAKIGVSGYLASDTSAHDLVSTMHRVAAGETVYPPRLTALLMSRLADRSNDCSSRTGVHALTSREREIAALMADGLSNKVIAHRLGIAQATAKNHIHSILEKWDVRSRGEAAAHYRQKTDGESEAYLPIPARSPPVPTLRVWSGTQALPSALRTRRAVSAGYPHAA